MLIKSVICVHLWLSLAVEVVWGEEETID